MRTVVRRVELVVEKGLCDLFDVVRFRLTRALVDGVAGHVLVCHRGTLENVEALAHVPVTELFHSHYRLVVHLNPLCFDDLVQSRSDVLRLEGREAELCAARLEGGDDLVHIITDEAEPRVCRVVLNHCALW